MEQKAKNIHQRVAQVKKDLMGVEIKKSGENKFAGFKYHELSDFLSEIVKLNQTHGVNDTIRIDPTTQTAVLRLTSVDDKEDYTETVVPYVEAQMTSKTDPIQRMGATITYMRRYLYMTAYAIQENDTVDAAPQSEKTPKPSADENAKAKAKFKAYVRQQVGDQHETAAIGRALSELGEMDIEDVTFTKGAKQALVKGVSKYVEENGLNKEEDIDA